MPVRTNLYNEGGGTNRQYPLVISGKRTSRDKQGRKRGGVSGREGFVIPTKDKYPNELVPADQGKTRLKEKTQKGGGTMRERPKKKIKEKPWNKVKQAVGIKKKKKKKGEKRQVFERI